MELGIGVVLGGIITILTAIFVENLRKPDLELRLTPPSDHSYQGKPAKNVRFVHLRLANKALPRWAAWMSRSPATQCHGTITFHHLLDGQNIFGRSMPIRWSASPEPVPLVLRLNNQTFQMFDPSRLNLEPRWDVFAGEGAEFGIAARFDYESECYGWSNENYFSDPMWRNPRWKLSSGRYLVRVTVVSAGEKCTGIFRLINDVPQDAFRLEPPLKSDIVRD